VNQVKDKAALLIKNSAQPKAPLAAAPAGPAGGTHAQAGSIPADRASQLNHGQALIYNKAQFKMMEFAAWIDGGRKKKDLPKALYLNCEGGPGSGKSFTIGTLDDAAEELGVTHMKMAPMASAANLINGRTIHSACGLPVNAPPGASLEHLKVTKLQHLNSHKTIWAIFIDEVSAVNYHQFFELDRRYRKIMGVDLPFGGLCVILWGDFFSCRRPVQVTRVFSTP
jgi:hypothetical protein